MRTQYLLVLCILILGLALTALLLAPAYAPSQAAPTAPANELRVCLDGPPACDYATIQAAVDAAQSEDIIKIAGGIYSDINFRAGVSQVVYISKTITLQGGYTAADWTTPDPLANPTILNAGGKGRVIYVSGANPVIRGLHLTDGSAIAGQGDEQASGGGAYLYQAAASLEGNWIYANFAGGCGGGIFARGGVPTLKNNAVHDNAANISGGGVCLEASNAWLINTAVVRNEAGQYGSGLRIFETSPRLLHTTIANNGVTGAGDGVGIYISSTRGSYVIMTNTILVGHSVGLTGTLESDEVSLAGVLLSNTVNYGGEGVIVVSDVIDGDPAFDNDGYHLTRDSAAIDRGVQTAINTDIDEQPRSGVPDLGADEWVCDVALATVAVDGPLYGYTGVSYVFTAAVQPVSLTLPVVYTWQATDQQPAAVSANSLVRAIAWTWTKAGPKTITVTAENCGGSYTAVYQITIEANPDCPYPLTGVSIEGPALGAPNAPLEFTAAVVPTNATPPVSFIWSPAPSDQDGPWASYVWAESGLQAITVTAQNCGGSVSGAHRIIISDEPGVEVRPELGGRIVYTSSQATTTTIEIPAGAVNTTTVVIYRPVLTPTEPVLPGHRYAGEGFELDAYQRGLLRPGFRFEGSRTVTVTIRYSDADVAGLDEATLRLYRWVLTPLPPHWEIIGTRALESQTPPDIQNNVLAASLRGFTQFGKIGLGVSVSDKTYYLPLVIKN